MRTFGILKLVVLLGGGGGALLQTGFCLIPDIRDMVHSSYCVDIVKC